jgi:hypothetical protein
MLSTDLGSRQRKETAHMATKKRAVSDEHKAALARGRDHRRVVDAYLRIVGAPKKRGRKVSVEELNRRHDAAVARANEAEGADRLLAIQEAKDLERRIAEFERAGEGVDLAKLERQFVKVAKTYSVGKGISYGAWREAGVSAEVLKKAGISRTRG